MKSLTCFQRLMMHIENMKTGHGPNQISVQLHRSLPTKYVFCHFYSCETWSSHIQHLVKMLTLDTENITWYYCVAMRECLSIEFMVMKWKQRWSGHFVHLEYRQDPQQTLYGEPVGRRHLKHKPNKHYKDCLKDTLMVNIDLACEKVYFKDSDEDWYEWLCERQDWISRAKTGCSLYGEHKFPLTKSYEKGWLD